MDYKVIDRKRGDKSNLKILVGVAPRSIVAQYVDVLQSAGLVVAGLQIEDTAIVNALHKSVSKRKSKKGGIPTEIYIDLGNHRSSIIMAENGLIQFSFSIKNATKVLYRAISKREGTPSDEVKKRVIACGLDKAKCPQEYPVMERHYTLIAKEIQKAMRFHSRTTSKKGYELILTGGSALTKNLPEFFTEKLGVPTRVGDPFTNIRKRGIAKNQNPGEWNIYTSAIGLALTGLFRTNL